MRRLVLATAAVLLTAACSGAGHATPSQTGSSAAASPSPTVTFLPDDVTLSLGAIGSDTQKIAHDGGGESESADCRQLGADASSAGTETLPNPAWQTQWHKTMGELQKAADECSSAQSTGDQATMQQALTDLTAADDDILTFNKMTG